MATSSGGFLLENTIMKKLLIIGVCLLLSACGHFTRMEANYIGYAQICVQGVNYLQFTSGATVQYDTKGKVVMCKG